LLSANLNGELAIGISRYEPSASTGDDSYEHTGEEAGLVLSGQLELTISSKKYILESGDSFSFKSQLKHSHVNPSLTEDTVVVWANAPISLRR
jgi:quercetin dioxygenase-like cupin family protein